MINPSAMANIEVPGDSPAAQPIDEKLQKLVDKALYNGGRPAAQKIRNFLNGAWLGEPLHVVLPHAPIGASTVAMVCDALEPASGPRASALSADTSLAIRLA